MEKSFVVRPCSVHSLEDCLNAPPDGYRISSVLYQGEGTEGASHYVVIYEIDPYRALAAAGLHSEEEG